jgi:hypothetical protein
MLLKEPIPTRISVTVNEQSKEQKAKVINSHELRVCLVQPRGRGGEGRDF